MQRRLLILILGLCCTSAALADRYLRSAARNCFPHDHQMRINGMRLVLAPEISDQCSVFSVRDNCAVTQKWYYLHAKH